MFMYTQPLNQYLVGGLWYNSWKTFLLNKSSCVIICQYVSAKSCPARSVQNSHRCSHLSSPVGEVKSPQETNDDGHLEPLEKV